MKHTDILHSKLSSETELKIMGKSEGTLTPGVDGAPSLKQVNKHIFNDSDFVKAIVCTEENGNTLRKMNKSDESQNIQREKGVPETTVSSNGTSTNILNSLLNFSVGSFPDMEGLERNCPSAQTKFLQYTNSSHRGITYNVVRHHLGKRYYKSKKKQYDDLCFGNNSHKTRLKFNKANKIEFIAGISMKKFMSTSVVKTRCQAKVATVNLLYKKEENGDDQKCRSKLANLADKGCTGPQYNDRNNSHFLNDNGSDVDDGNEVGGSKAECSKCEDSASEESKSGFTNCKGLNSEESHSRDDIKSSCSVASEDDYSKRDSENEESKKVRDENTILCTESDYLSDGSSEAARDTECSVDFENISGSVFWSEDVSNDNHTDDNSDYGDDNKSTPYYINTVTEEINEFFLRNFDAANKGDNSQPNSSGTTALSPEQANTNKELNCPFLDNDPDILGSSACRAAVFPSLTRGRKILSLTSNHLENYKRMFDAFKSRIFSNERDSENYDDQKGESCLRRSVSNLNNDSLPGKSRVLKIASSDSEICNVDKNEISTNSETTNAEETYRTLPAWCDWEAEFDSDYRVVRSPPHLTMSNCVELVSNVSGENLPKEDNGKKLRDQDKQLGRAKGKHFSCCRQKKDSKVSSACQGKKASIKNKTTAKSSGKKKVINFKFQGVPKHNQFQYMNNEMCAELTANTVPNEEQGKEHERQHQTKIPTSVEGRLVTPSFQKNQTVIATPDSMNIDFFENTTDLREMQTVPEDNDCRKEMLKKKEQLKNDNRESTNIREIAGVTESSQPCYNSAQCNENQVAALAVFKAPPDAKITSSDGTSYRANEEYSPAEPRSRLLETEQTAKNTQRLNINQSDSGKNKKLSKFDSKALNTLGENSAEIKSDIGDKQAARWQSGPNKRLHYFSDQKITSKMPKKKHLEPNVASRQLYSVISSFSQKNTHMKSNPESPMTTTPNIYKVVSQPLSSHDTEMKLPKNSILGYKAHNRRLDNKKGQKSKDNDYKKWLGKKYTKAVKPNRSSRSQTLANKSRSENSLTAVPGKNIKDVHPISVRPLSKQPRCYFKEQKSTKITSINPINGTSVDMNPATIFGAKLPNVNSNEPLTIDVHKVNDKDLQVITEDLRINASNGKGPQVVAEDLIVNASKSNREKYDYYYFQSDSDTAINPSGPNRTEKHPSSEIYFINIPKRRTSVTDISAPSLKKSRSLTDVYFSRNPNKYELLEESVNSEEAYAYSFADEENGEDFSITNESLKSCSDIKSHSSGQEDDQSTKDVIFYDDGLLNLINKRAVINTTNQNTLTKIIFGNEASSEVTNSMPNFKKPLTIGDLLAESISLPSEEISPIETVMPEVNLVQEMENAFRNKRQRRQRRTKCEREQGIIIPSKEEPCMGDNERMENAQNEYDKTTRSQEMAGGKGAQSILLAATEDHSFETKLVNFENHNFMKIRRSDTDYKRDVHSSGVALNTSRQTDYPPDQSEYPVIQKSKQCIDNESDLEVSEDDNNDDLCSQYSCDSEENDSDEYDCDPKLQHKLALLLQRIEDTNCIKIVSTQEFYKKKHGAASLLNDLAKMIDHNLEKCIESEQEKVSNEQNLPANELLSETCSRKALKKQKACPKLEKHSAKKVQDCAGCEKQMYDDKQGQFDEQTDEDGDKSLEKMGCLARHVSKQISDMNRLSKSDDMSSLTPENVLCEYEKEHNRSSHENQKEVKGRGNGIHKELTGAERKQQLGCENNGTVYRLRELEPKEKDNSYSLSSVGSATKGGKALESSQFKRSRNTESTEKSHSDFYKKRIYSDYSHESDTSEKENNQGDYNHGDQCQKANCDDYYDSDRNSLGPVSSSSVAPIFRGTDVLHKYQPQMNADFPSDDLDTGKDPPSNQIYEDQTSASRQHLYHIGPGNSESAGDDKSTSDYTGTNLPLAGKEHLHGGSKNEGSDNNFNLISAAKDISRVNHTLKNTPSDGCYWQEDVKGDAEEDAECVVKADERKLDDDYEKYKRHHAFNDTSSHTKQRILKTVGTQYDHPEETKDDKCKHMYTVVGAAGNSSDIYYHHTQEKLSSYGSDQTLSVDCHLRQNQLEESPLPDRAIPQMLNFTRCQAVLAKSHFPKPKKNVTFQDDEKGEAHKKDTSDKYIDTSHTHDSVSENRRAAEPEGGRVHNTEFSSRTYSKNTTVANSSQQASSVKRRASSKTPERNERSLLQSWEYDDKEISLPCFVSYIHKNRRNKSEREGTNKLVSVSSTDTVSHQQSKHNRTTGGNVKGKIIHESPHKDGQYSRTGINTRQAATEKGIVQRSNTSQRTTSTNVCSRNDPGECKIQSGNNPLLKEDCPKHSIANLNSNDRSAGRAQKYADTTNKPSYSSTGSPTASFEYAISGRTKIDEPSKAKVVPKPRADLGSTCLQRNHGGSEVAKKSIESTRGGFRGTGVEPKDTKRGLTVGRNERETAMCRFKIASNESVSTRNGNKKASNDFDKARNGHRVASNESEISTNGHKVARNESVTYTNGHEVARPEPSVTRSGHNMALNEPDLAKVSRELITRKVNKDLPYSDDCSSQDTMKRCKMDDLSMVSRLGTGKKRPLNPFNLTSSRVQEVSSSRSALTSSRDQEVSSSRSASCHDMSGHPQTNQLMIQGNEQQLPKENNSFVINYPSPTCVYPKRNNKTYSNETTISPTFVSSQSARRNASESESPISCKLFRGNPRDNDDLLVTREYSSEGFFIPESDEEDKCNERYAKGLESKTERFSPELKRRRNSSADYDVQERYQNTHWNSLCEHPGVKLRQHFFANTAGRTARECDLMGDFRPQREAEDEQSYLANKKQELQKGFQNYWGERMKMRREEFERLRQEYRPSIRLAPDAAVIGQRQYLDEKMSLASLEVSRKAVRTEMDKTHRKTSLSDTHRKKTVSEIDGIPKKTYRSSAVMQQPLHLSDVHVQVHKVDKSAVQRMRGQSNDRVVERHEHRMPEFPGKDLFRLAHKALLGSNFPKECTPSTLLTVEKSKEIQENKSPSLLSRLFSSFSRPDIRCYMNGRGNEDMSESSETKESFVGTDGSGEGFVSVAEMRGQVAKTSNYISNAGIHLRNRRRQSHSPQMSVTGLRDIKSDYNENNNSNAKIHERQGILRTNNRYTFSNARNNPSKKAIAIIQAKHLDSPCISPSRTFPDIQKKAKRSSKYASVVPLSHGRIASSRKLHKYFTNAETSLAVCIPTSSATSGKGTMLFMIILAMPLSTQSEDSFRRLLFHPSLSESEQTLAQRETFSREADPFFSNMGPEFGGL